MNSGPIKNIILSRLRLDASLIEIEHYISVEMGGYTQEETDDAYNAVHDICNGMAHEIIEHFNGVLDGKNSRIALLEKGFLKVLGLKDRRIAKLEELVTLKAMEVDDEVQS